MGIAKERLANDVQVHVIAQLREMRDNLLLVKGPPGIRKTRMIAYMIWVLVYFSKKVVGAAPGNKAADNLAITVRNNQPEWARDVEALMIRLATTSIEKQTVAQEVAPNSVDASKPLPPQHRASVDDEQEHVVKTYETYENLLAQYSDDEIKWFEWGAKAEEWQRNMENVNAAKYFNVNTSEVPYDMTMGYHIHKMMEADATKADADPKAKQAGSLTSEEIASDLNPSAEYNEQYHAYIQAEGKVSFKARRQFFNLRWITSMITGCVIQVPCAERDCI